MNPDAELATPKGPAQVQDPTRAERQSARRAAESRATVPDLELSLTAEVSDLLGALATAGGTEGPSLAAALVRATGIALREHPRINGAYRDGSFELYSRVNVGVAMGSSVPTILDADGKDAGEIERELRAKAAAVHEGTITSPELAGATFTVYALGALGVERASLPLLGHQAAALTAGAVRAVPVLQGRAIVPGHEMTLTLTCDHRILDLARGGAFLVRVRSLLEAPGEVLG